RRIFFQAEDGIRDRNVTGVQTCALPISRPDAIAAAHAHTTYGQIWSTTGKIIKPLSQDSCAFYNDLALFDDYTGVVYEEEEGRRIAAALADKKAAILKNNGLLTVGGSVAEAAWWFILRS